MELVKGLPPNIKEIQEVFGETPKEVVFTYGSKVYIQDMETIPDHIKIHETVHIKQQNNDPEGWWKKYLSDQVFRLQEEIEAYGTQFAWVKKNTRGDKFHKDVLYILARDLSSSMYGNLLSIGEAESKIRNKKTAESLL